VLLLLERKQHSYAQGHMLCLHYTLCLTQLSIVRNLILMGCSDDIPVSGLLVIDAVGWQSMYFVVMPRVTRETSEYWGGGTTADRFALDLLYLLN
jgi:hypothetical protein